jgi:uncharacterized protein
MLEALLGFAIGLSLSLLGGGGSILTVPALVYLIGQTPQAAVTTSLAIVGANSVLGAMVHRTQGTLNWRVALVFGGFGMIVSYLAAGFSKAWSPDALMVAFAVLMLIISLLLMTRKNSTNAECALEDPILWKIVAGGAGVGLLTGILGVGGGFLIVPALVMLVGLPMHHAVGTSLVVIAMNSAAGFLGHLTGMSLDLTLIVVFVTGGLFGTLTGAQLGRRMNPGLLRRAFAVFVTALALFLLYDNLPKLL